MIFSGYVFMSVVYLFVYTRDLKKKNSAVRIYLKKMR